MNPGRWCRCSRWMSSVLVVGAVFGGVVPRHACAQSDATIMADVSLDTTVSTALLNAVNTSEPFSFEHIDRRQPSPGGRGSLVWAGSEAKVLTAIPSFVVKLRPAGPAVVGAEPSLATDIEFLFEEKTITVRPWRPTRREYAGGLRIFRAGRGVRKSVVRLEGGREVAVFAPQLKSPLGGVGVVVCLTALEQRPAREDSHDPNDLLLMPRRDAFDVVESMVVARAAVDGRLTSGILPGKAEAKLLGTHNIAPAVQSTDETESRDPLVGVTYSPKAPPIFVSERSSGTFGAIRGTVRLETPAGHQQFAERESRVWFERLAENPTVSAGGTDAIPLTLIERSPELAHANPIYGSCFAVVEQVSTTRTYFDAPPPTPEPNEPSVAPPSGITPLSSASDRR
jgi:hypothetical protein